jgi:hypothetical protein
MNRKGYPQSIMAEIIITPETIRGQAIAQLVEALCKKRKVAGSITDEVAGFFKLT